MRKYILVYNKDFEISKAARESFYDLGVEIVEVSDFLDQNYGKELEEVVILIPFEKETGNDYSANKEVNDAVVNVSLNKSLVVILPIHELMQLVALDKQKIEDEEPYNLLTMAIHKDIVYNEVPSMAKSYYVVALNEDENMISVKLKTFVQHPSFNYIDAGSLDSGIELGVILLNGEDVEMDSMGLDDIFGMFTKNHTAHTVFGKFDLENLIKLGKQDGNSELSVESLFDEYEMVSNKMPINEYPITEAIIYTCSKLDGYSYVEDVFFGRRSVRVLDRVGEVSTPINKYIYEIEKLDSDANSVTVYVTLNSDKFEASARLDVVVDGRTNQLNRMLVDMNINLKNLDTLSESSHSLNRVSVEVTDDLSLFKKVCEFIDEKINYGKCIEIDV